MQQHSLESLQGTIERITFHSEASGFCVLRVNCKGIRDIVTITGICPPIHAGVLIEASGNWVNDKQYGQQFKAS